MKKLIVIALFVLVGIGHLSAEILFSSMERPDSGGKNICIQPRYWYAVSFFNKDQYQSISKVRVRLTGNSNTNIKLEGRLYSRLEAEKKCKLDDNLIARFKMTEVTQVPDGVIVTFEPMEKTILYPDTELFFAISGKTWAPNPFWGTAVKDSSVKMQGNDMLWFDTAPKYAIKWRQGAKDTLPMISIQVNPATAEETSKAMNDPDRQTEAMLHKLWTQVRQERPRMFVTPEIITQLRQNPEKMEDLKSQINAALVNFPYQTEKPEEWFYAHKKKLDKLLEEKKISAYAYGKTIKCIDGGHKSALLYLVTDDRKYYDFALWSMQAHLEYLKDRYKNKAAANWYMFDRLKWLMAFDWIAKDMPEKLQIQMFEDWLKYVTFFMTVPKGECYSGATSGNYGVINLKFYAGVAAKGVKLSDEASRLAKQWLSEGYLDNVHSLEFRDKMNSKYGGAASSTLAYSIAEYLFSPFNFIYTCRSALGADPAKYLPDFSSIGNYIYWNMIPTSEPKNYYCFGYGDVSHQGCPFPDSKLSEHFHNMRNIFTGRQEDYRRIIAYLEKNIVYRAPVVMFIYTYLWDNEPDDNYREPEFPKAFCFENMGQTFMRSGSGPDDTYAMFVCGGNNIMHSHLDALHFTIYKNGFLAQDAGSRPPAADSKFWGRSLDSVAHNTILIHEPEEKAATSNWLVYNDKDWDIYGGQCYNKNSRILAFQNNDYFTYVAGDATDTYRKTKASEVTRQFLFIRPDYFVIFDRVVSVNEKFRKDFILRTGNSPSVDANKITVHHQDGIMRLTSLLPVEKDIRIIEGFDRENPKLLLKRDQFTDETITYLGAFRVEISPAKKQLSDHFLSFIQVGKKGDKLDISPEVITKENQSGVVFKADDKVYEIFFNNTGEVTGNIKISDKNGTILFQSNFSNQIDEQKPLVK